MADRRGSIAILAFGLAERIALIASRSWADAATGFLLSRTAVPSRAGHITIKSQPIAIATSTARFDRSIAHFLAAGSFEV